MRPVRIHHQIPNGESLQCRLSALGRCCKKHVGRHHGAVQPLHNSVAPRAADNTDIAAGYFRKNVGDEKFPQPKRIWRAGRLAVHSHFVSSPAALDDGHHLAVCRVAHATEICPPCVQISSNARLNCFQLARLHKIDSTIRRGLLPTNAPIVFTNNPPAVVLATVATLTGAA